MGRAFQLEGAECTEAQSVRWVRVNDEMFQVELEHSCLGKLVGQAGAVTSSSRRFSHIDSGMDGPLTS